MLTPLELFVFVFATVSLIWISIALLVLGRTLQVAWPRLVLLAALPIVTVGYFLVAGAVGNTDPLFGRGTLLVPLVMAMTFLPYPILLTLMNRSARRMLMSDGRVVSEVFR